MTVDIRPAQSSDAVALRSLIATMGYEASAEDLHQRLLSLPEHHAVYVAHAGPDILGWVHVTISHSLIKGPRAELGGLAVAAHAQGTGAGSALLRAAEQWATQRGVRTMFLRSGAEREAAHAFYLSRGYRVVKTQVALTKVLAISDEDLQAVRIGELKPHDAPITLVAYDPDWPRIFARAADRIGAALGDTALSIEHVGSTSVPGLTAKPIIDILLVVPDAADESSYAPALEAAGFVLRIREPEWFEHRLFKGPDIDLNLHVFGAGTAEVDRMLRFRDRLRTDETDRERYARTKRELAGRTWRHVQHYADAKTAVVEEILARAEAATSGSSGTPETRPR